MDTQKLQEFNADLKILLDNYGVNLQIEQKIVVVPNKTMEETTPEVTGTEVVEETAEVTGTETPTEEVAE